MTGFGRSLCEVNNKSILIQLRSLNSKQTDLNIKMPSLYREKETEVRNKVASALVRGKVDVNITIESKGKSAGHAINREVFDGYLAQLKDLVMDHGITSEPDYVGMITRFPEVMQQSKEEIDATEWEAISEHLEQAIKELIAFREREGQQLEDDMKLRIDLIGKGLEKVADFEGDRMDRVRERLNKWIEESALKEQVNKDRFEQEMIYYLEKMDITEEKVRLKTHLNYFLNTIKEEGAIGKKLGFIAQEIGREINTIGSKANNSDIQKLVVEMKDELEKIKEQLLNVL